MPAVIQSSFTRGEVSPSLYGRIDTAAYHIALRTAWNVIIHAHGGASNRPGLEFVGPVKDHSKTPRLIPFRFKGTDTYMLELGDEYLRVMRNGSHVATAGGFIAGITQADPAVVTTFNPHGYSDGAEIVLADIVGMVELNNRRCLVNNSTATTFELSDQITGLTIDSTDFTAYASGGTTAEIFELAAPYTQADLALVKFTQSADVITLVHPDYAQRELRRAGHDAWTLTTISFDPVQAYPTDCIATQNGTPGSTDLKYQITAISSDGQESLPGLRNSNKAITAISLGNPVVVTSAAHGFADGHDVQIDSVVGTTELNGRRYKVANKTTDTFELQGVNGASFSAYVSGGIATQTFARATTGAATLSATNNLALTWDAVADAVRYVVYKYENGLYGWLGETEFNTFTDDGSKTPDLTITPPAARDPFDGADNTPGAVGYYEQRRVFGGSNNLPDTSDYSRTADQANFTRSTPTQADDAIRATLTSLEVNQIRHYVPMDHLLVFTSGEEWRVDAGDNNRFSADTIRQHPQSSWGCGHQRPAKIGRVVLFVQENNSVVRSIGYELAADGYTGSDMTVLANHLFRDDAIVDWAMARAPDPLIVAVRADGRAAAFTFNPEQEVVAWTRWGTRVQDDFEAVASIRTGSEQDDSVYFVVRRLINGRTVRYIERTHSRRFSDVRDCFFVDAGLSYDAPATVTGVVLGNPVKVMLSPGHGFVGGDEVDVRGITWVPDVDAVYTEAQPDQLNDGRYIVDAAAADYVTLQDEDGDPVDATAWNAYVKGGEMREAATVLYGFHHLAGEPVVALADGSVIRGLTVAADGSLTLPDSYSQVHVGLSYVSDVETLDIAVPQPGSDGLQGRLKNVHQLVIRLERSGGLLAGPRAAKLRELKLRASENYGAPTGLFTGDAKLVISAEWNSNGRVLLRQPDPLPMTVLAVVPRFETEDGREE